jgi:hypothetical protein
MTKKYSYTKREQKAEREIDQFLQSVNYNASSATSVLAELRAFSEIA